MSAQTFPDAAGAGGQMDRTPAPAALLAAILDDVSPLSWMDDAACQAHDPDLFFPPDEDDAPMNAYAQTLLAKKICAGCPVRAECLDYAVTNHIMFGVWGGVPERPRRALRLQARQQAPPQCRNGHIRTDENTRTDDFGRHCLDCDAEWSAKNRRGRPRDDAPRRKYTRKQQVA